MRKFRKSEIFGMTETLVVSSRGQVTLPAALRKRLGISPGDVLIVEDRNGELVFKPAAVFEIERFTDEQIAEWDREDALGVDERARIEARLAASTKP
jgi:AbrB family looped-hinge helix DNA binding protein